MGLIRSCGGAVPAALGYSADGEAGLGMLQQLIGPPQALLTQPLHRHHANLPLETLVPSAAATGVAGAAGARFSIAASNKGRWGDGDEKS